jgi:hypothetical protein
MRLGVALALSAGAATAQPASDPGLAQSMAACGGIANVQKRVACYDALNQKANPAAPQAAAPETQRRDFGFKTPSLPHIPNPLLAPKAAARLATARPAGKPNDGVNQITTRIDHTRRGPLGQLILVTAEGSVWMLDDNAPAIEPAKGAPVLIRRGGFGSLFCDLDRYRAIRCQRLE